MASAAVGDEVDRVRLATPSVDHPRERIHRAANCRRHSQPDSAGRQAAAEQRVLDARGQAEETCRGELRAHGQAEKYDHKIYGWNSRLDELQAAVLRVKLPTLDQDNERRRQIAERYTQHFRRLAVQTPPSFADRQSVYHQYVIETPRRNNLRQFLATRGVGTGIYYPLPLHQHEAWIARSLPHYSLPEAERYANQNIALPMFAELTDAEVDDVISAVRDFFSMRD